MSLVDRCACDDLHAGARPDDHVKVRWHIAEVKPQEAGDLHAPLTQLGPGRDRHR
jgi:hypothetical protein